MNGLGSWSVVEWGLLVGFCCDGFGFFSLVIRSLVCWSVPVLGVVVGSSVSLVSVVALMVSASISLIFVVSSIVSAVSIISVVSVASIFSAFFLVPVVPVVFIVVIAPLIEISVISLILPFFVSSLFVVALSFFIPLLMSRFLFAIILWFFTPLIIFVAAEVFSLLASLVMSFWLIVLQRPIHFFILVHLLIVSIGPMPLCGLSHLLEIQILAAVGACEVFSLRFYGLVLYVFR